ncbi:MAG: alcohol dehydrogenase catalytic domain-containing protein [Oscillibacter sp.]|nr:alcohol dehydrogenase catalytic domain-containing protein [Oscillibacter sp.]
MKVLLMNKPGDVHVTDIPMPEPKENEVLIRVKAAGICTNDIRDFQGDCSYSYPRIGGHEFCGVIEKMGGGVSGFQKGQRVVSYIINADHTCHLCRTGHENICFHHTNSHIFTNPDGISGYCGFGEYVIAKAQDIMVYSETTSFEKMAFTEPLACVVNSINRTGIELGDDVAVIGGGTMGLLHVMVARLRGARVIVSEPLAERREKALALGAAAVIDPMSCDAVQEVMRLTNGQGAAVVINGLANPAVMPQAMDMTAPCGVCVAFSSMHPNKPVPVDVGAMHSLQKSLIGAVSPTVKAYYQSVQLIDKGLVDPSLLTEQIFDYTDFDNAMACAMRPDTYKVILKFGEI